MIILRQKEYSNFKAKKLKGAVTGVLDKKDALIGRVTKKQPTTVNSIRNKRKAINIVNTGRNAVNNPVGAAVDTTSFVIGKPHKAVAVATIPTPLPTTLTLAGSSAIDKIPAVKKWGNTVNKAADSFKSKTGINKINLKLV